MTDDSSWPILCKLVEQLRASNSWTGETHVQKTAFALERLAGLDWPMGFIIYKYGPFSFRLREQLGEMRAWGYLELDYEPGGYGPRHRLTPKGQILASGADINSEILELVVKRMGNLGVKELEKIATGLFLLTEPANQSATDSGLQDQLKNCKPHLSDDEVREAYQQARAFLASSRQFA